MADTSIYDLKVLNLLPISQVLKDAKSIWLTPQKKGIF
jgi:hypothetical protein